MSNKLVALTRKILAVEADLPYRFRYDTEERKSENPNIDDFEYIVFDETFSDTSFGLGGIGGQMIVAAPVIVAFPVTTYQPAFVYFNGQFAYEADPANENFRNDLRDQHLVSKHGSGKYR